MKRTLRLHKQTLAELTTDEMTSVVGADGTHLTCYTGITVCGLCGALVGDLPDVATIDSPCGTR